MVKVLLEWVLGASGILEIKFADGLKNWGITHTMKARIKAEKDLYWL